jgi:flagellar protein FlaG
MDMELNINSINSQINQNQKPNQSNSVENQKEITRLDNIDYSKSVEKTENKKQELTEIVKKQDFNTAIDSVNEYVEMFNNKVSFTIDDKSREIIHVYDNETGDLIRQIPPKEMIELVDKLEEIAGIIFNNKV